MSRDQFFGTEDIKGLAQQLIDGVGPFRHLHDNIKGTNGQEQILKHIYCRNAAAMSLVVVDCDITLSDITTMSNGTKKGVTGTLWTHATNTLKSCKKAMTLLPWLSHKMVQIDSSKSIIVGYFSGIISSNH